MPRRRKAAAASGEAAAASKPARARKPAATAGTAGRKRAATKDAGTTAKEAAATGKKTPEGTAAGRKPARSKPARATSGTGRKAETEDKAPARASRAKPTAGTSVPRRGKAKAAAATTEAPAKTTRAPAKATEAPASRKAASSAQTDTPPQAPAARPAPQDTPPTLDGAAPSTEPRLPERLFGNLERIEQLTQRMLAAVAHKPRTNPGVEAPGPAFYATTSQAMLKQMALQPARIVQAQTKFWGETLRHYAESQAEFLRGNLSAPPREAPRDGRFRNPLWETHPYFAFVRRQYEINARALTEAVQEMPIDDPAERHRVTWFTKQVVDMMAPTNFLATNPDALERAVETEGESLVKGMENLVADLEAANGEMIVSLVDKSAFKVGENIATAPGDVVVRTPLYELLQFTPSTDQVRKLPLILFPPWINKFYILDLKPQNSMIRWLVDQGFTLFVVSWKNPGKSMSGTSMDDYVSAYVEAMDHVARLTGEPRLNAVGYCIGGTTLHLALAWLASRGDDRVASATFFTTLADFSNLGEFTTFLQNDFVGGIEAEVVDKGVLGAQLMARTFSFLRANDLIWGPAIRHYMLGETPPAFDLLYWNADSTNLPGQMAIDYLRGLCQHNGFAGDGYEVKGVPVHIREVTVPLCSVACEGDHIAPWLDCWRGFSQTGARDRTFILSESGHIAGIINPPGRVKYGHYTSDAGFAGTAQDWLAGATKHEGSWWPTWLDWLGPKAGPMVPARKVEESLGAAPGSYVHEAHDTV